MYEFVGDSFLYLGGDRVAGFLLEGENMRLLVLQKLRGWTRLEVPAATVVADGELRSKIKGARGMALTDGLFGDGLISFVGTSGHYTAACKAFVRWSSLQSGRRQLKPANLGGRDFWRVRMLGVWGPGCNFNFLEALCAIWVGQLSSVSLYSVPILVRAVVCLP